VPGECRGVPGECRGVPGSAGECRGVPGSAGQLESEKNTMLAKSLKDMSVYIAPELAAEPEIVFNAGSHTELIRMAWRDYQLLARPHVAQFAM
jgi:hypothetical protein